MAFIEAKNNVIDIVESISPTYMKKIQFICKDRGTNQNFSPDFPYEKLRDLAGYGNRIFELIASSGPREVPIVTGGEIGYFDTRMTLRILYSVTSRAELDDMFQSDMPQVHNALLHISDWGESLENIINFDENIIAEQINDQNEIKGYIINISFDMHWAYHPC